MYSTGGIFYKSSSPYCYRSSSQCPTSEELIATRTAGLLFPSSPLHTVGFVQVVLGGLVWADIKESPAIFYLARLTKHLKCIPHLKVKSWQKRPSMWPSKQAKPSSTKLFVTLWRSGVHFGTQPSLLLFSLTALPHKDSFLRQDLAFALPGSPEGLRLLVAGLTWWAMSCSGVWWPGPAVARPAWSQAVGFGSTCFMALPAASPFFWDLHKIKKKYKITER